MKGQTDYDVTEVISVDDYIATRSRVVGKDEQQRVRKDAVHIHQEDKKNALWWIKTFFSINLLLIVGLGFTVAWFFSTLYPIIDQPRITQIGKEPALGGPRLSQDALVEILAKHSVEGFDIFQGVIGVDIKTGVNINDLADIAGPLAPLVANMTYDQAYALANDLNTAAVDNGACKVITNRAEANFGNVGLSSDAAKVRKENHLMATVVSYCRWLLSSTFSRALETVRLCSTH